MCGGFFPIIRQLNIYLGLKLLVRQENSDPCVPSLPECFFLQITIQFSSFQFSCSVLSDFATPWTAARQGSVSIANSRSLLDFMSIELVMPSSHLILCHPLLLLLSIFPSIRVCSNESVLHIMWPKHWSFSFNISPSNEYSGLISFSGLLGSPCSPRNSQKSSPTPQFKSINSSVLNFLYSPTLQLPQLQ